MGSWHLTEQTSRLSEAPRLPDNQRERLDHFLNQYHDNQPLGGTPEFRVRISEIVDALDHLKSPTSRDISDTINKVHGQLVQLGKPKDPGDRALRVHALDFLKELKGVFAVPKAHQALPRDYSLSNTLDSLKREKDPNKLAKFLISELGPNSRLVWNSVNLVTGIYNLSQMDPGWPHASFALPLAEAFTQALTKVSAKDSFDRHSTSNLFNTLPRIIEALERAHPPRPILETSLIKTASRIIDDLQGVPNPEYVRNFFLYPLRDLKTCNLSPEAGVAACGLVARVTELLSRVRDSDSLEVIAMTFHALNGVSSWTHNDEGQLRLTTILSDLNRRLEQNSSPLCSISIGSILYGLKGINHSSLNHDSEAQVSKTLTLMAEKIASLPPDQVLNARCISSAFHSLTVATTVREGPVAKATQDLLAAIEPRIPRSVETLEDLGHMASALIPLSATRRTRIKLIKTLFESVDRSATTNLKPTSEGNADLISWQTTKQMYALYDTPLPAALAAVLAPLNDSVQHTISTSNSERRIADWIVKDYRVSVLRVPFEDGYNLDIAIQLPTTRGTLKKINIEVDGPHHNEPIQRALDVIRDQHLNLKGWSILRIPTTATREEVRRMLDSLVRG